jgi:hypothetical protein
MDLKETVCEVLNWIRAQKTIEKNDVLKCIEAFLHSLETEGSHLFLLSIPVAFLTLSRQIPEYCFRTGHDGFPPHPYNSLLINLGSSRYYIFLGLTRV